MNADPTTPKPSRSRRRAIAILVYSILLIWLTYITASRWNGVPADTSLAFWGGTVSRAPLDPRLDRTAELLAALAAIPNDRFSPPDGIHWPLGEPIRPDEAVWGTWTPKTRPALQAIIDLLKTPGIQEPLARLAAIKPGVCALTHESRERMRYVQDLLCAQARYHHAEQGDIDEASDDLEILMRLAVLCMTSPNWEGLADGRNAESKAEVETSRMAFENHLTQAQASRLITILRSNLPDDRAQWQRYVDAVTSMNLADLDRSYTIDNNGDGWLVLSWIDILNNDPSSYPRLGLWNSLSPLFNSRRTVSAKIAWGRQQMEAVDKLSSPEALRELARLDQHVPFNVLDGPTLSWWASTNYLRYREIFTNHIARRRATIAEIALSAYRRKHGEYPASLDVLIGEYLDAVPVDPFDDQPLRYLRKPGRKDYLLYSVGMNLVDDGGCRGSGGTSTGDVPFYHTRSD